MKKYLILLLVAGLFAFTACSEDDETTEDETTTDPIVGTWVLVEVNPALFDPQGCGEDLSTITFNENNSGNGTLYLEASDCEAESSSVSWTKNNNQYSIEIPIPAIGRQQGNVEFRNNNGRFVFSPDGIPGVTLTFDRAVEE